MTASLNVLVVPLDWGLGHATRCIPVIRYLLEQGCSVRIGASGAAAVLLQANFPDLELLPLEGYGIRYSRHRRMFAVKIIFQAPKILAAIRRERKWLQEQQRRYGFDLIISDNRYGIRDKDTFSVIMTHQLQIRSGQGRAVDRLLRWMHYSLLQRFHQCWIVDNPGMDGIGGLLSHPPVLPRNARYIGLLSQMEAQEAPKDGRHILALLSGPEPMRTILENELLRQAAACRSFAFVLVAGNPRGSTPANLPGHIKYFTHLDAVALGPLLLNARLVICRSGYSTLMDLTAVRGRALLIPTPGQAEQEYLGAHLMKLGLFLCRRQEQLALEADIEAALQYPGFSDRDYFLGGKRMRSVIRSLLDQLPEDRNYNVHSTI